MANAYKRYRAQLLANTQTSLLQVPDATTAIVKSIWVTNHGASAAVIRTSFAPLGSGLHYLTYALSINGGEYYDVVGTKPTGPLVLESGDILYVQSSVADVAVVVSALLVDRN